MRQALKSVQIEASAHSREKFLSDLRKARETEDVAEANRFLDKMRHRLDNPDVLSVDTLYQFMLSYRSALRLLLVNCLHELRLSGMPR